MTWYSLSVSVSAGATVMESPVWTPIGSTFSIEQMMMQLSAVAHHLHLEFFPAEHGTLRSARSSIGEACDAAVDDLDELLLGVGDTAAGAAEREARPDDRRQADVVERFQRLRRPLIEYERGVSSPILVMALRNSSRSSALSMASAVAPIILTLNLSSVPIFLRRQRGS